MKFNWKKLLDREKISIEILKQWGEKDADYYAPGVLIRVQNGKGTLREVYGEIKDLNKSFVACLLEDQPLLQLQGDEYFCPTCEKIIRSGYGLEQNFHMNMTDINARKNQFPLKDAVENIYPLLGLLESGFYVILDTTLHPTDGNGGFFWDRQVDVLTKGSCLYYYGEGEWGNLRPYYTIATEPKEKCCKERVEYYRKNPHSRAIAYYMDGYMTALIDGHHKTFAAALQHKDVNALVIVPGHFIYSGKMMKAGYQLAYRMGDMDFNVDDLRITEKELKELKDRNRSKQLSSEKALGILNSFYRYKSNFQFPYQTEDLVKWYPTVDEQASIERAGRIDNELLSSILTKEKVCSEYEVCILMKALAGLKHERLLELGDFFCKQIHSGDILYVVLESLMTLPRTEQLEQFFIDKMVYLEEDYPTVKKLILEYL